MQKKENRTNEWILTSDAGKKWLTPPHSRDTPKNRNEPGKNLEKSILSTSLLNMALVLQWTTSSVHWRCDRRKSVQKNQYYHALRIPYPCTHNRKIWQRTYKVLSHSTWAIFAKLCNGSHCTTSQKSLRRYDAQGLLWPQNHQILSIGLYLRNDAIASTVKPRL